MKNPLLKKLLLLLLILSPAISRAQSLYEMKFSDSDGNTYLGFLVYHNEQESYMRVAYNSNGAYRVVNINYIGTSGTENGRQYFVLTGLNPTFITESGGETYSPDVFVWLWNEDGTVDLPYTTDDPEFKPESFKQVDSYYELDIKTLTEEYLHQFYSTDETDYINFVAMLNDGGMHTLDNSEYNEYDTSSFYYEENDTYTDNTTTDNAGNNYNNSNNGNNTNTNVTSSNDNNNGSVTMHLIVVANTEIGDIGASCEIDKKNLVSEFDGIAEALHVGFKRYIIDGKDFTKEKVNNLLNTFSPSKNDVVVFVYTGHGFRWADQTDKYPNMDMRYNAYQRLNSETSLPLSEVYAKIKAKGARLSIVFGDCCNADIGVNQRTSASFLGSRNNPNFKQQKLETLFLQSQGDMIVTAASPGEVSWSNSVNGGFFISSFLQAFHEEISYLSNDTADWDGMINAAVEHAKYKTSPQACSVCSTQNAVKSVKVTYR